MDSKEVYLKSSVGTLPYMAPELFPKDWSETETAEVQYIETVDIYSLALVPHELFGAGRAFYPKCRTQHFLYMSKCRGDTPQLNLAQVPSRMRTVVMLGVASDPKARPTLGQFRAAVAHAHPDNIVCTGFAMSTPSESVAALMADAMREGRWFEETEVTIRDWIVGGFSRPLYRTTLNNFGEVVAVNTVSLPDGNDSDYLRLLVNEARLLLSFEHPNIVKVTFILISQITNVKKIYMFWKPRL
jgi:serine/threonine protein kinase